MKYLLLLSLFIISCESTQNQNLKEDIFYKRDLGITYNGVQTTGSAVINSAPQYTFQFTAGGKINMLIGDTCHREVAYYSDQNTVTIIYNPVPGIEDLDCGLDLSAFSKDGQAQWGHIEFSNNRYQVPAIVKCNGDTVNYVGTSLCQAKEGLLEQIVFKYPVVISQANKCPLPTSKDTLTWTFNSFPLGLCTYLFREDFGTNIRFHRLVTIGYQSIKIGGK